MKIVHRSDALHTATTREAALRRLAHANRWLLAGSVVLTGVLTDVAANAFPGHKKTRRASAKAQEASRSAHKHPQPPPAPPKKAQTTEQAPPASSASAPEQQQTEHAPAESSQPAESSAPAEPAAPPAQETPAPEAKSEAPPPETHESAPAQEPSAPVVSGGS